MSVADIPRDWRRTPAGRGFSAVSGVRRQGVPAARAAPARAQWGAFIQLQQGRSDGPDRLALALRRLILMAHGQVAAEGEVHPRGRWASSSRRYDAGASGGKSRTQPATAAEAATRDRRRKNGRVVVDPAVEGAVEEGRGSGRAGGGDLRAGLTRRPWPSRCALLPRCWSRRRPRSPSSCRRRSRS